MASIATQLDTLTNKEAELKALRKAVKQKKADREWEANKKAVNPAYIVGSLRLATPEERSLDHIKGARVCSIECQTCGRERLVNPQDAFQVRFCVEHKADARKAAAKAKRAAKRLEGKSVEDVEAELAALQAELDSLS